VNLPDPAIHDRRLRNGSGPTQADVDFLDSIPTELEDPARDRLTRTFLTRSQLRQLPMVDYLVEGVISPRSAALLVGATGSGKTFLAIGLACSVGTGVPWLGHPVTRTKVLYVVGEGAYGLNNRIDAWERVCQQPVGDQDLIIAVKPDSLISPSTWRALKAVALDRQIGFVVLDTLSSLGSDMDEVKDAPRLTRALSDLATSIGGTALLVHHPGWNDQSRSRGGTQLEANVDEVLILASETADVITLTRKSR
jgi:RecA-family ATPase